MSLRVVMRGDGCEGQLCAGGSMPTAGSRGTRLDASRKPWIWTGSGTARRGAEGARAGAATHLDGRLDSEAASERGTGHSGHDRCVRSECAVDGDEAVAEECDWVPLWHRASLGRAR